MSKEFDLDVTFEESDPDLSSLTKAELQAAVDDLPVSLKPVAQGLLIEERTMSDVSQALSIRQAELVTRLHRAKKIIAASRGL